MSKKRYLSMSKFGRYGRFANQLIQYAHLRTFAMIADLELQLPEWVGTKLFGCNEPLATRSLPAYRETAKGLSHAEFPGVEAVIGHDFQGFAQYHTKHIAEHRDFIRGLYVPVPEVAARVEPARDRLRETGETVIGIHLRRGDYGQTIFPITPVSWYLRWLETNWERFGAPTLFIATEDASLVDEFAEYNPQTIDTLDVAVQKQAADVSTLKHDIATQNIRAMDYYPDFYLLSQCNVIVMPNSTFSFFASMLAENLQELWRSNLDLAGFERINPWNDWPILRQDVRSYPHLEGIALKANAYW